VRESTAYRYLQVSPVAGALGAEVQGVDLARPLAPEVVGEIRQALLAHLACSTPSRFPLTAATPSSPTNTWPTKPSPRD